LLADFSMPLLSSSRENTTVTPAVSGVPSWVWVILAVWVATAVLLITGHPLWGLVGFISPAPWFVYQLLPCGSQAFGLGYRSFETQNREVWLTIDDGPDPKTTPAILEILKRKKMRATFFLIGRKASAHPDLVERILHAGHEVANHSSSHPSATFWSLPPHALAAELDKDAAPSSGVAGPRFFRPPVGIKNPWLKASLGRRGLTLVLWSGRGLDGLNQPAKQSFDRLVPQIKPGAILLVHEVEAAPERSVEYLDLVTDYLAAQGYGCTLPDVGQLRLPRA
jgi:peptidoglycan/xylan/chitin deacetylase (PgdA/CDA1 family)